MVTFNLSFSDQEAAGLFRGHGFTVEERQFTRHVPVYHNREREEPFICLCVIHPHTGQPVPLGIAFERVFYARRKQLFIGDIDKLLVLEALNQNQK